MKKNIQLGCYGYNFEFDDGSRDDRFAGLDVSNCNGSMFELTLEDTKRLRDFLIECLPIKATRTEMLRLQMQAILDATNGAPK